jgi:L-seryl-tRNA selenium transferase
MAKIPTRLEELLPVGAFEKVVDLLQRPDLSGKLREALGKVGLKEMNPLEQVQDAWQQAKSWLGSMLDGHDHPNQYRINATGCLFASQSDHAPAIPSVALSGAKTASAFTNHDACLNRSQEVLERSFGVKQVAWLTDPLSALQVVSRSLGQKVVMARCDCVRIAGFGDVRSMLAAFGNSIQEIGASNGATPQDWITALSGVSGANLLLVSPSGLPREQWTEHRSNALSAARSHGAKVIEVLVDGCFDRKIAGPLGFPHPMDRIQQGTSLTVVPMHCLAGGVRGVLCLGDSASIQAINNQASIVDCQLDSASISANLLALQLATLEDEMDCGLTGALRLNPENLKNRSQRMAIQLQGVGPIVKAEVVESQHGLGPSPWDQYRLSNSVIALQTSQDASDLVDKLRSGDPNHPAIELRRAESGLQIDLRFVLPDDDHRIVSAIQSLSK